MGTPAHMTNPRAHSRVRLRCAFTVPIPVPPLAAEAVAGWGVYTCNGRGLELGFKRTSEDGNMRDVIK